MIIETISYRTLFTLVLEIFIEDSVLIPNVMGLQGTVRSFGPLTSEAE
jgi:hypothetical protein